MIRKLTGQPQVIAKDEIIIDVNGVGYGAFAPPQVVAEAETAGEIEVLTYLAVRDDALDLFAFSDQSQLSLFENLLGVSGVGPKSALGVLSIADAATISAAIADEDTSYLTNVSGIGKKTAEKIILELRDKFDDIQPAASSKSRTEDSEAVEALVALGYSKTEARKAISQIDADIETTEAKVKEALKQLGQ